MPESLLKDIFTKPTVPGAKARYRKPAGESLREAGAWLGGQWSKPLVRRLTVSVLTVMVAGGSAFAYTHLRTRPAPDVFEDDLADVLDYTLLSDDFNKLPLDERLALMKDLIKKIKGMDSNDSALMAAFAAGITGKARAQVQKNAEKLMVDVWDRFAEEYTEVPPEDREAYLDKAFVDFTRMAEEISGFSTGMDDQKRLDEARKQAKRDEEQFRKMQRPTMDPGRSGQFLQWANTRGQALATPEQRGRMAGFGRDMTRRLRGQDIATGRPKEAPAGTGGAGPSGTWGPGGPAGPGGN